MIFVGLWNVSALVVFGNSRRKKKKKLYDRKMWTLIPLSVCIAHFIESFKQEREMNRNVSSIVKSGNFGSDDIEEELEEKS